MAEILLVHGAWHGSWCWDDVAAALRDRGHAVVAIDLPGHDRPGDTGRIWNRIGQYVGAVGEAAEAMTDPVLVGHSMGGYVVQRYLEDSSAMVVLDGGHDLMVDTSWPLLVDAIDAAIS